MTRNNFIGKCIAEMIESDFSIKFIKRIYNSKHAHSYFSDAPDEFIISYFHGKDEQDWYWDFIHEYAHFIQFKFEKEKWEKYNKYCERFSNYIGGITKTISPITIYKMQELEADGNNKAFNIIKDNNLHLDVDKYMKNNNLYILSYPFMAKYKKFNFFSDNTIWPLIPTLPMTIGEMVKFPHKKLIGDIFKNEFK